MTQFLPVSQFFDLVVIGSGPAGLALVARVLEKWPAALYTEEEHRHLHWLRRSQPRLLKTKRRGAGSDRYICGVTQPREPGGATDCECHRAIRILVVDRTGAWLGLWDKLFRAFDIRHLRSPMFFHPAPFDIDALTAYANRTSQNLRCRTCDPLEDSHSSCHLPAPDLLEISNCVGREVSKHKQKKRRSAVTPGPAVNERERRDYFAPSLALFRGFVDEDIVARYGLDGAWLEPTHAFAPSMTDRTSRPVSLVKAEATALEWGELHVEGWDRLHGFCLTLSGTDGETYKIGAKAIVCANGAGGVPAIPAQLRAASPPTSPTVTDSGPGWCHSSALARPDIQFPPPTSLPSSAAPLVVLGGGLTSAQLCDLALRRGVARVVLSLRGHMKVKPFDVDLPWLGRHANLYKMQFWQEEDMHARLAMVRAARGGGSITPIYAKILRAHEKRGRLEIRACTDIESARWEAGGWALTLRGTEKSGDKGESVVCKTTLRASYIVSATGATPCFSSLPFLRPFLNEHPVEEIGGLPVLNESLQIGDFPLFCVGGYSALQVGPGAFNLEGFRAAADRVAVRLEELAKGTSPTESYSSLGRLGEEVRSVSVPEVPLGWHERQKYTLFNSFNNLAIDVEN
ncbi:hypothetical protein K488DRAFT_83827 [Vararia minispora EC-137]|uniref:Uncharacterized protein n=1 Tax=Vararia minispora EC-137 TaxID=1314806 RepID=A0ACB8QSG1_9AGAM|nr:hypothetical protein K488DRAFT_83827 [Vararia minispora EC-137]